VKSLQTTDDGRQVMAIVHMDLWTFGPGELIKLDEIMLCIFLYHFQGT
jgi:hypothetical protein